MWADNFNFVKDIIDSKYNKIEVAVTEVTLEAAFLRYCNCQAQAHLEAELALFPQ